jgi:hypothetical protein
MNKPSKSKYRIGWFSTGRDQAARDLLRAVWRIIKGGEIKGRAIAEIKRRGGERNPLFREIRKHRLAREFPLIIATIKAFSEGMVKIAGDRVVNSDGQPIEGYNLSCEIDQRVKGILAK